MGHARLQCVLLGAVPIPSSAQIRLPPLPAPELPVPPLPTQFKSFVPKGGVGTGMDGAGLADAPAQPATGKT